MWLAVIFVRGYKISSIADATVKLSSTIRQAIDCIDKSSLQIALVLDEGDCLAGVVTDGNIRRGLLQGIDLDEPVGKIMDANPKSVRDGEGRAAALTLMKVHDIKQIPVLDSEGRPVGMETYTRHLGLGVRKTWAVIMTGGVSARLAPLTDTMPKPLIANGGKPVPEIIINNRRDQGIEKIFISVKYPAQMIEDHFGDGSDLQVSIEYLRETERRGRRPVPFTIEAKRADCRDERRFIDVNRLQTIV